MDVTEGHEVQELDKEYKMKQVILKPLQHREQECIGVYFANDAVINRAVQQKAGARWSRTNKCWYVPLGKEHYNKLFFALKGITDIDYSELQQYLIDKKAQASTAATRLQQPQHPVQRINTVESPAAWVSRRAVVYKQQKISPSNTHVIPAMEQHLKLKAYSPSTIRTYLNEMAQLLQTLGDIPADQLKPEHLKRYLVYCYEKLGLKENTLHSRINALKFYYEQVLNREKFFWKIPRPKRPMLLPRLLNERELASLFNALSNKKHKAMLFTAYSAGLRVSEIVNLRISDIDSSRMQIFVRRAKGKKDRYVNLSPVLLDILRSYIRESHPKPREYLFESGQTGGAYPARTVQQIFGIARKKAGIKKEVGIHSLRHSFATHLLDKGTDIRYIKDLLGHFNIRTTERYLHVSKKQLVNIVSPFDDLWKKEAIEW
jgi:integrase/recombinase XerD